MKLRVRTLKNVEYIIDVDEKDTVAKLKEEIEKAVPSMESSKLLVIHQGKILCSSASLTDYPNIRDQDKLVVLMPKAKATSGSTADNTSSSEPVEKNSSNSDAGKTSSGEIQEQSDSKDQTTVAKSLVDPDGTTARSKPSDDKSATNSAGDGAALNRNLPESGTRSGEQRSAVSAADIQDGIGAPSVLEDTRESTVEALCAMGFERTAVVEALNAAFYNPERAVEYLTSGMPTGAMNEQTVRDAGDSSANLAEPNSPDSTEGDRSSPGYRNLDVLRTHPFFDQFRAAIQANPQILPGMLQMVRNRNPELAELITNNQQEFLQMLMESPETQNPDDASDALDDAAIQNQIRRVSPAEMESIQNLKALGFSEAQCLQALVACDWNEERAANFLFETEDDYRNVISEDEV